MWLERNAKYFYKIIHIPNNEFKLQSYKIIHIPNNEFKLQSISKIYRSTQWQEDLHKATQTDEKFGSCLNTKTVSSALFY